MNLNNSVTYSLYSINKKDPAGNSNLNGNPIQHQYGAGSNAYSVWVVYFESFSKFQIRRSNISSSTLQNGGLEVDYASLRSVLGLHTTIVDGNVFLMRQRRVKGSNVPYPNPIYAQYTADGNLKSQWNATADDLPAGVSTSSNLNNLQAWVDASAPGLNYVYNFLLDAALAFGTDDSNQCQVVWLGNTYQAAYALKRFALDSEHVVIKRDQNVNANEYSVFTMFKNPLTKTWHQRQIATQILPQELGIQENGDHY